MIGFINGCFDVLHKGHIYFISQASLHCDSLIVGLNSDASIRRLKGIKRPINNESKRKAVLEALPIIDAVIIFDEDTPIRLISEIKPDILIKAEEYEDAPELIGFKGKVVFVPRLQQFSTTKMLEAQN